MKREGKRQELCLSKVTKMLKERKNNAIKVELIVSTWTLVLASPTFSIFFTPIFGAGTMRGTLIKGIRPRHYPPTKTDSRSFPTFQHNVAEH